MGCVGIGGEVVGWMGPCANPGRWHILQVIFIICAALTLVFTVPLTVLDQYPAHQHTSSQIVYWIYDNQ